MKKKKRISFYRTTITMFNLSFSLLNIFLLSFFVSVFCCCYFVHSAKRENVMHMNQTGKITNSGGERISCLRVRV